MQYHFQCSTGELQKLLYSVCIRHPKLMMTRKPHLKPTPCQDASLWNSFFMYVLTIINTGTPTRLGNKPGAAEPPGTAQRTPGSCPEGLATSNRTEHSDFAYEPSNEWDRVLHTSAQRSHVSQKPEKGKKMRNSMHLLSANPLLSEPFQEFPLDN